jgi:hypothetical protein
MYAAEQLRQQKTFPSTCWTLDHSVISVPQWAHSSSAMCVHLRTRMACTGGAICPLDSSGPSIEAMRDRSMRSFAIASRATGKPAETPPIVERSSDRALVLAPAMQQARGGQLPQTIRPANDLGELS